MLVVRANLSILFTILGEMLWVLLGVKGWCNGEMAEVGEIFVSKLFDGSFCVTAIRLELGSDWLSNPTVWVEVADNESLLWGSWLCWLEYLFICIFLCLCNLRILEKLSNWMLIDGDCFD